MPGEPHDPSLDTLLDLDGQTLFVDAAGRYWVTFVVTRGPVSAAKPHGLDDTLTLHGPGGERLVGFDNAHPVAEGSGPGRRRRIAQDHRHRLRTVRAYDCTDAPTLLADFWAELDAVLKEKGVLP